MEHAVKPIGAEPEADEHLPHCPEAVAGVIPGLLPQPYCQVYRGGGGAALLLLFVAELLDAVEVPDEPELLEEAEVADELAETEAAELPDELLLPEALELLPYTLFQPGSPG